jgi:hypothetical protein
LFLLNDALADAPIGFDHEDIRRGVCLPAGLLENGANVRKKSRL